MSTMHECKCCHGKKKVICPRCGGYGTMDDKEKSTCYYVREIKKWYVLHVMEREW